jgi:succinoglycan biosynthesis transport protein ExoP
MTGPGGTGEMADPEASRWWLELNANSDTARGYETLVSSLAMVTARQPLASLLVTSVQPEEGKTTVAMNLSLTMARAGRKVLVLDADLRRSRVHQIVGVSRAPGFAELLAGTAGVLDVIRAVKVSGDLAGSSETLSVITSGQPSSASFASLGTPRVKEIIAATASRYDLVIVDAPPVFAVNDPQLLAPAVDGVILVLAAGRVSEKDAARAKAQIEDSGGHVIGVVMNWFEEQVHGPSVHPYSSYYDPR